MKKSLSDLGDELFRRQFKKSSYAPSVEDKRIFLEWIKNIEPSNLKKLKKKTEWADIKTPKNEPVPPSSDAENAKNSQENSKTLFEDWIQSQLPQHLSSISISYKDNDRPKNFKKSPASATPTIDLHGFSRSDALRELKLFLSHLPRGEKKLRVIHGKGLSKGQPSVIRQDIREWLDSQKKYASWIADFSYETPKNGGHGATAIWIKKGEYYGKN